MDDRLWRSLAEIEVAFSRGGRVLFSPSSVDCACRGLVMRSRLVRRPGGEGDEVFGLSDLHSSLLIFPRRW